MNTRILSAVLPTLLMMLTSNVRADDKPNDNAKMTDGAKMKKQCDDMKGMDMSKMSAAEHEAMKKCQQATPPKQDDKKPKY